MKAKKKKKYTKKQLVIMLIMLLCAIVSSYFYYQAESQHASSKIENTTIEVGDVNTLKDIPEYTNEPYVTIKQNIPNFEESDFTTNSFEKYSPLDELGRCGVAFANLSGDTMPKEGEKRESISDIEPSGWQSKKYSKDIIRTQYLYNRCHLIAYKLSAENDNEKNLITGTRYFNTKGMLPFETEVMEYLEANPSKHVLYRVTPIYEGNNLVASGVQMEAQSVEDKGKSICFHVYIYNVQPGITINYATGESKLA